MQENRSFNHYFGTLPGVRGFSNPTAMTLSTGRSVFHQPVQTTTPPGTTQYSNPDGYLLPFIATATGRVIRSIRDSSAGGPQDMAVSPDGRMLYVTNPVAKALWVISTARDQVTASIRAGDEPYAVAVSPDGKTAYVTDMDSNSVRVLSTATLKKVATIPVGGDPGAVAVTPDGSQVWVGNILQGNINVINPATNSVVATVSAGSGTATIDDAPIAITFVKDWPAARTRLSAWSPSVSSRPMASWPWC